jgi:hypothetical protein
VHFVYALTEGMTISLADFWSANDRMKTIAFSIPDEFLNIDMRFWLGRSMDAAGK